MKRKGLFFIIFLCLFETGISQPLVIGWQNCFGETFEDRAYDVLKIEDGYLIASAWALNDVWLIKTDLNGNFSWDTKLGGSNIEIPKRILALLDSNYVIIGGSSSSDGDISFDPYPESSDYWLIKVNGSGDVLWDKILGGNCVEHAWEGIISSDNGIIALGSTCSNDGDISNYFGTWDAWMVKLDNQGNIVWDFTIGTEDFDFASALIETTDHGFLVSCGSTPTVGGNIICQPYNEYSEIVLLKLDSAANIEWQQCYGGSGDESILDMIETESGYLLSCSVYSGDGDITGAGYHLGYDNYGNQTRDIWLVKIDFTGNIIWSKCFGGSWNESGDRLFQTIDGEIILFGETGSFDGDVTGNHSAGYGISDIWVAKVSQTGELLWQQCFGGNGYDRIGSVVVNNDDGSYVVASTTYDFNSGLVECPISNGSYQVWLFQLIDTAIVSVNEQYTNENKIIVYPIPAINNVIFEVLDDLPISRPYKNLHRIIISDLWGRIIKEIPVTGKKMIWDLNGVLPGVYFYYFQSESITSRGKFIIQ